jgi:hypothetical protein
MRTQSVGSVKSHGSPRTVLAKSAPGWLVCVEAPPIVNDCAAASAASPIANMMVAAARPNRRIVVCLTITDLYPRASLPAFHTAAAGEREAADVLQTGPAPHTAGPSIGTPDTLDEPRPLGLGTRKRACLHVR